MTAQTEKALKDLPPEREGAMVRVAIAFTAWAERWFPDAFIFVAIAVIIVAAGALINGASPLDTSVAFGNGFWSLITFTMQMAFVVIGGYVVATSAPAAALIRRLAAAPKSGVAAVGMVAAVALFASLLNWGLSLDLQRPAGAGAGQEARAENGLPRRRRGGLSRARFGLGAGAFLLRRAASGQCRAACPRRCCRSPASSPSPRRSSCGSRWSVAAIIIAVAIAIAFCRRPARTRPDRRSHGHRRLAPSDVKEIAPPAQPGEWLEHSPILTVLIVLLGARLDHPRILPPERDDRDFQPQYL